MVSPNALSHESTDATGLPRILEAIERIILRSGHASLSMRSIAQEAEVSLGTVSYFGSKEALIDAYAQYLLEWYLAQAAVIQSEASADARAAFFDTIRFLVSDLTTERTRKLFPELWAMALHNDRIRAMMDSLYANERDVLEGLFRAGWPDLDERQVALVIGSAIPMIEGFTIFLPGPGALYPGLAPEDAVMGWLTAVLQSFE